MKRTKLLASLLLVLACACGDDGQDGMDSPNGADNPPNLGAQIDRVGRAATATGLIDAFNGDDTAKGMSKDDYNAATPADGADFKEQVMFSLAVLDSLDQNCGNQLLADGASERYSALADVLVDDQLYVDSTREVCGTYLGLEAEIVGAIDPGTGGCGGRMPDDDVIERIYSVLALGSLDGFDDTITGNDVSNSSSFPFLAAPH